MGKTRSINVELSTEVIQVLESRVASGEYPSTAAAIEAAVRLLVQEDGDADLQAWISKDIAQRVRASLEDPREPLSADEAERRIAGFIDRSARSRA